LYQQQVQLLEEWIILAVTVWPLPGGHTHAGALADDMPDLEPLQSMPIDEDIHYWTYRDDEEDEATVHAMLSAEEEAVKQCLHCGGVYIKEIIDD